MNALAKSLRHPTPAVHAAYRFEPLESRRLLSGPELEDYDPAFEHAMVDKHGCIKWRGEKVFITTALRHECVTLDPLRDTDLWAVRFGPVHLGDLDGERLERGLILPKKTRPRVSGMSLG
jgi:hypothetical protein